MQKPIFFDLDGTLTKGNSWYQFNLYFGMSKVEDETLLDWYNREIVTYDEWDNIIVKILKEKGQCTEQKVNEFVKTIEPSPGVIEMIASCKQKGYVTIILSGTMKQIAESFRQRIGADLDYTTSEIIFDSEGKFKTIENEKDDGAGKLKIFESVCAELEVDPGEVIYVGDSGNDLEIFRRTKKAILIGSNQQLQPLAWKQIQNIEKVIEFA